MCELTPEYIRLLWGMSGEEKLHTAVKTWWFARNLKTTFLKQQDPDRNEEKIEIKVKEIMLYASD